MNLPFKVVKILLGLVLPIMVYSQNLVPNPSFEEYINFDTAKVAAWHKAQKSDTPDYFNLDAKKPSNNIFGEFIGGIQPLDGTAFIGLFCYRINKERDIKNIREFIETTLSQKLEKDSLYKIQLSLCLDAESNIAIKNFGVLLSDIPLSYNKDFKLFAYIPQVEYNSTFLDSSSNWMTLQSLYKAKGNERYLILGNFKSDKQTQIEKIQAVKIKKKKRKWDLIPGELSSYYYIDNVSIEKVAISQIPPEVADIPVETIETRTDTFNIDEIKLDTAIILKNIVFDFNKADLKPQSFKELNKLLLLMKNHSQVRIKLEGHTDNVGSFNFNFNLSLMRVESVVKYMVERGVDPDRIEYAGYSYTFPIAPNDTEEGRQMNRRVVFKVIEK